VGSVIDGRVGVEHTATDAADGLLVQLRGRQTKRGVQAPQGDHHSCAVEAVRRVAVPRPTSTKWRGGNRWGDDGLLLLLLLLLRGALLGLSLLLQWLLDLLSLLLSVLLLTL
jgi:hypothetical protein